MTKEIKELERIRSILSYVTGFEDDDQENIEDARKSVGRVIDSLADQPAQRKPLKDDTCTWAIPDRDHMPDTWQASCGAMWTFTDGGPKDNDMHFCPQCGKPAIEAPHGIKENT